MKKFLSLVLALVMTMSLVTVSAGAADFTDDSKITYKEAVDVMTALGVVGGYSDGSFNPNGTLTRGAAAKIICNLILGTTASEALVANVAPYSDVPTDNVFAGYIAYLAKEGVVGGYADGTFRPAATLTGYAFMKMLLGVIGLDASVEGYNDANWSISVAKRALSESVDLTNGLEGEFNGTKAVTREEACLYAFNAIKAVPFTYDTKSTIVVGGVTVSNTSEAKQDTSDTAKKYYEGVFKLTEKKDTGNDTDIMGRPAHTWYASKTKFTDDTKIGTYADVADYTVIATKDYAGGAVALYKDVVDEDYTGSSVATKYKNGKTYSDGSVVAGDVVEFYLTDEVVTTAIYTRYTMAQIDKVTTKLTKAELKEDATCKVTFKNVSGGATVTKLDTEIAGFDAASYVEDAYVLYVLEDDSTSKEVILSELAESVEGKVTATKDGKVKIDGTYYKDYTSASIGDEGTYYLNKAGQIVHADAKTTKSDNYAYIYNVTGKVDTNDDGNNDKIVTVYYVTVDGVKAKAEADVEFKPTGSSAVEAYLGDETGLKLGSFNNNVFTMDSAAKTVVAFSLNKDGEFVQETMKDLQAEGSNLTINKTTPVVGAGAVADEDTVFVFVYTESGKVKTTVATGYKNVNVTGAATIVAHDDGEAEYVFVTNKNNGKVVTDDAKLAVLLSTTAEVTENDDEDTIYTYDVVIDGEETTLSFNNSDGNDITGKYDGKVFAYEMEDGYAKIDTSVTVVESNMAGKGNDYFVSAANSKYYSTADAEIYTITVEFENEADCNAYKADTTSKAAEAVTVSEGASFEKDAWVRYTVADDNEVDVLFVVEFVY